MLFSAKLYSNTVYLLKNGLFLLFQLRGKFRFSRFPPKKFYNINYYSGQSYKAHTIVINDSRVAPDLKLPHITTLES